jgi:hypothetical protein
MATRIPSRPVPAVVPFVESGLASRSQIRLCWNARTSEKQIPGYDDGEGLKLELPRAQANRISPKNCGLRADCEGKRDSAKFFE